MNFHVIIKALREALIKSRYAECDWRTGNLRKCVRSEETCPKGALEAYSRTLEEPLGQRFAGDDVFYQCFLSNEKKRRVRERLPNAPGLSDRLI